MVAEGVQKMYCLLLLAVEPVATSFALATNGTHPAQPLHGCSKIPFTSTELMDTAEPQLDKSRKHYGPG